MKKVSILTPCYNSEKFLPIFFDSILMQEYENIELIIVNDGSVDNTEQVINKYRDIFKDKKFDFKYIKKENGGQASAIARGIKEVTGDYLIWPDSDDFLLKDSIIKKANYLDTHPECAIVRSNGFIYNENNIDKPIGVISKINRITYLKDFINFIVPWVPGCFMINMRYFDSVNPDRIIPLSSCGQNIQMILPIVYKYPCHYINENLFGYVIHPKSHSHIEKNFEMQMKTNEALYNCVKDTLELIPGNTDVFLQQSKNFFDKCKYQKAWENKLKNEMTNVEKEMRKENSFLPELYIMKYFKYSVFSKILYRILEKIMRGIR